MEHHSDLLQGFVSQLFNALPLPPMFKSGFLNNRDNFKEMHQQINKHLAHDEWLELDVAMEDIFKSPFCSDEEIMGELFSQIIIPQKHWKALERGKSEHSISIFRVIDAITFFGNKESIVKCFSECGGVLVVQKFFENRQCSEAEQIYCLRILVGLLDKTDDLEYAKLVVPVAVQFKDMIEKKKITFKVMQQGVQLIHLVSFCQGSQDLMSKVFKSGMVSYAVKVLTKCQKLKQDTPPVDIISIWNSVCRTIGAVLSKQSANFNKGNVPILTLNMLKIIRKSLIDLKEHKTQKFNTLDAAVLVLLLLIDRTNKGSDLMGLKEYGVIKEVVNVMLIILQDDELKSCSRGMVCNSYIIVSWMIDVEPNVRVIAPILTTIYESFTEDSTSHSTSSHAGFVATFCYQAVKRGSKEDVKYLINHGLMPLLARLRDYLTCVSSLFELVNSLYNVILKVPDTDEFSYFEKRLYNTLLYQYWSPINCENGKAHKKEKIILAYVITAIGISCMCTDEERFKSLDDYFYYNFQEIQAGEIPIELPYPGSFLIEKMVKVNCFKSNVLPHIWYIAKHGPDELVKVLFKSLPDAEEHTKVSTREEMKEQVLRYVLVEVKAVFERKSEYERSVLIRITRFLTSIPCTEQGDIVLYHLEDLVSPCLGLLEDQNDKKIINNVKKFIKNLHYS